jgi:hypothetical protein
MSLILCYGKISLLIFFWKAIRNYQLLFAYLLKQIYNDQNKEFRIKDRV